MHSRYSKHCSLIAKSNRGSSFGTWPMSFLSADREAVSVRDSSQGAVEDELVVCAHVPAGDPVALSVGVDDVVLDPVEAGPGALLGASLDPTQDEVPLAAAVLQVEPVLVWEPDG